MPGGRKTNNKSSEDSDLVKKCRTIRETTSDILVEAVQEQLAQGVKCRPDLLKQANIEVSQAVSAKLWKSGGNPVVCYEEGDQTPLSGDSKQLLRMKWARWMDYGPYRASDPFFQSTAWAKAIFAGDYDGFIKILAGKTCEEISKLLNMRESLMNFCAVFHVVQGALLICSTDQELREVNLLCRTNLNVRNEHVRILRKLISLGVDVNVRDVAGFTPLHHCVIRIGNDVTLEMAEILIQAGAKVDAKNRMGETPLLESTMYNKLDFISLLLKHGATPSIEDNDGHSAQELALYNLRIRNMFGKAELDRAKAERKELREVGGRLSQCSVCKKSSNTMKCSGCFSVWFCGRECQRTAWPTHQRECKEIRAQYSVCNLVPVANFTAVCENYSTGKFYETETSGPRKHHFVVKIQLCLTDMKPKMGGSMMIYNKDRTVFCLLEKKFNDLVHTKLEKLIIDQGVGGLKGYFHAILTKEGLSKMEINTENILPRECW